MHVNVSFCAVEVFKVVKNLQQKKRIRGGGVEREMIRLKNNHNDELIDRCKHIFTLTVIA